MAQLTDSVAQQIMGEIADLVKRIEAVSEKVPQTEKLQQAINSVLNEFKKTAGMTVMGETARMKAELAQAVSDVAGKVANDVASKKNVQWIAGCFAVVFLSFSSFGWMMNSKGYTAGFAFGHERGYEEAKSERAAESWANTPQGKYAYRLAMVGSISMLAICEEKYGWRIEGEYCIPYPTRNENGQEVSMGWKIK
jgi:hypothetical protein